MVGLLGATHGWAAEKSTKKLVDDAAKAWAEGRTADSIRLLEAARAQHPTGRIIFNLAKAYERAQDTENAIKMYELYLEQPDSEALVVKRVRVALTGLYREVALKAAGPTPTPADARRPGAPVGDVTCSSAGRCGARCAHRRRGGEPDVDADHRGSGAARHGSGRTGGAAAAHGRLGLLRRGSRRRRDWGGARGLGVKHREPGARHGRPSVEAAVARSSNGARDHGRRGAHCRRRVGGGGGGPLHRRRRQGARAMNTRRSAVVNLRFGLAPCRSGASTLRHEPSAALRKERARHRLSSFGGGLVGALPRPGEPCRAGSSWSPRGAVSEDRSRFALSSPGRLRVHSGETSRARAARHFACFNVGRMKPTAHGPHRGAPKR